LRRKSAVAGVALESAAERDPVPAYRCSKLVKAAVETKVNVAPMGAWASLARVEMLVPP